ncbi:MAG TPA: beta-ketoacyl-ACP synthase [Polyangiales bacterium]|nr:beta-ketoacyl-ACP synthase [Polyangiales bacterium]
MQHPERASIVAMGLVCALGDGCGEAFDALVRGEVRASAPPFALPFETVTGTVGGLLEPLPPALREWDTRLARIALRALPQVSQAVERLRQRFGAERVAVLVGTSTGGLDATEPAYRHYRATEQRAPTFSLRRAHAFDALANLLRDRLGLRGPCYAVSTACTSSAKALASAQRLIATGAVDAALVVGADALCETTVRGFHGLGVLARGPARPFSSERTGIHIGEGAALLVLARDSEGPVQLAAVGESSDAHSMSAPQPEGLGAGNAMVRALAHAGLDASQVDYVNAHGTGTQQNDVAESRALRRVLGPHTPVGSSKGATGHTLGACGAIEAIFCAQAIIRGELPPSTGALPLDRELGVNVLRAPERKPVRVTLSNALAFGGSNASVLLIAS